MTSQKSLVLVVDDDVRILRMMKRTLELEGYRVLTASGGEAAPRYTKAISKFSLSSSALAIRGSSVLSILKGRKLCCSFLTILHLRGETIMDLIYYSLKLFPI